MTTPPASRPHPVRVPLSLLDRANNRHQVPESQVLAEVVERAQRAEQLGYHRFWVAEHHGVPGIAGSAPTVLMAALAARTTTMRIGSGGIMVPSHQPLVVAEHIGTLQALFPGRIDAGLGSSVGFTAPVRRALFQQDDARFQFPQMLTEVISYLDGTAQVTAYPRDQSYTDVFVLASRRSIALAAQAGAGVVVGGPAVVLASRRSATRPDTEHHPDIEAYRRTFQPSAQRQQRSWVMVAVHVAVADTDAQARDLLLPEAWAMARSRSIGTFEPLLPVAALPGQPDSPVVATAQETRRVDQHLEHAVFGAPEQVVAHLEQILAYTRADELLITGGMVDPTAQQYSDQLLHEAWYR